MGRNNKERRAAKRRDRTRTKATGRGGEQPGGRSRQAPGSGWPGASRAEGNGHSQGRREPLLDPADLASGLLWTVGSLRRQGRLTSSTVDRLMALEAPLVDEVAETYLLQVLGLLWDNGWQPSELLRHARRSLSAPTARLVGSLIATDHARRRAQSLDPAWVTQVDALDLPPADGRKGWLHRWQTGEGLDRAEAIEALVAIAAELPMLRPLEVLIAPPGRQTPLANIASMGTAGTSDPVLVKVRRLLAKAESSEFEAEASAFTAKAQELMARHAIDAAMVDAGHDVTEQPVVIRVPVDDPYVDAKSLLLHVVASEGRCRAVFMPDVALCTILGFATDVAAAELLFTSLLVQAQSALAAAARTAPAGSRVRSRRYRSSFLLSYANRIGDRLHAINQTVIAEADVQNGPSLLPALRARSDVLDQAMDERFGQLQSSPIRSANDPAGWAGGRAAADNARLNTADLDAARAS